MARCSYGLYSYGLYSYCLYSYGLYSYGLYSYGQLLRSASPLLMRQQGTCARRWCPMARAVGGWYGDGPREELITRGAACSYGLYSYGLYVVAELL